MTVGKELAVEFVLKFDVMVMTYICNSFVFVELVVDCVLFL